MDVAEYSRWDPEQTLRKEGRIWMWLCTQGRIRYRLGERRIGCGCGYVLKVGFRSDSEEGGLVWMWLCTQGRIRVRL